ncbi:MAG: DUF4258 domain-containing protein [Gammaproteobacteria bacterium]
MVLSAHLLTYSIVGRHKERDKLIATIDLLRALVAAGQVRISEHGWDELEADDISARDIVAGLDESQVIEDYPEFGKGRSVLILQADRNGDPIHVVWGIPKGFEAPAVLVTAYRPDPDRWDHTFTRRIR